MKKLRILFPFLIAVLMSIWLRGELLAAEKIAELPVPRQHANLDINDNGLDDFVGMDLDSNPPSLPPGWPRLMDIDDYEEGTVVGQGVLAGRIIKFNRDRMSPGLFGPDLSFDNLNPPMNPTEPGILTFESNDQGEFNVFMNLGTRGIHELKISCTDFTTTTTPGH